MTELRDAAPDSLAEEVGWVLANARQQAADPLLHLASRFCLAVDPPVHRAQVGRWESGATSVSHAQVSQYETVLGLPPGQLLVMVDVLARDREPVRGQPLLPPVRSPGWEDETDDLLDLAASGERMTGLQWRILATHLGSVPATFLRRDDWARLLRRVTRESELSVGLEYVLRDEAKRCLASHPRSRRVVLEQAESVLRDPVARVYGEAAGLLLAVGGPDPVGLVVRHLADPVGEGAHFTLLWLARRMVTDGRATAAQQAALVRCCVVALEDPGATERVQRAAAALLQVLDGPGRRALVEGLRLGAARRRVVRILEGRGALGEEQVRRLTDEIETRVALASATRGGLHPVLRRLLQMTSSLSAEDSRSTALTLLMLSPQGLVVGETYASALRWALRQSQEHVVDEALSVLAWVPPPTAIPLLLTLGLDPATAPTRALQALVCVANCRPATGTAPADHTPEEVVERVRASALARMAAVDPAPTPVVRAHLYLLGMYGRFDVVADLADPASVVGVAPEWAHGIRTWLDTPLGERPLPAT